jgi:hypothetical protein
VLQSRLIEGKKDIHDTYMLLVDMHFAILLKEISVAEAITILILKKKKSILKYEMIRTMKLIKKYTYNLNPGFMNLTK